MVRTAGAAAAAKALVPASRISGTAPTVRVPVTVLRARRLSTVLRARFTGTTADAARVAHRSALLLDG